MAFSRKIEPGQLTLYILFAADMLRCLTPLLCCLGMLGWTRWSPWTLCTKSCSNGTRYRTRICTGGAAGSFICSGTNSEVEVR